MEVPQAFLFEVLPLSTQKKRDGPNKQNWGFTGFGNCGFVSHFLELSEQRSISVYISLPYLGLCTTFETTALEQQFLTLFHLMHNGTQVIEACELDYLQLIEPLLVKRHHGQICVS